MIMVATKICSYVLLLLTFLGVSAAEDKIVVDLKEPAEFRAPIAIANFTDNSTKKDPKASVDIPAIIKNDLSLAGFFKIAENAAFPVDPEKEGFEVTKIEFKKWQSIDVIYLAKGWYKIEGNRIVVGTYLYDIVSSKLIEHNRYTGAATQVRKIVHRFSDRVVELINGHPGICETQIALTAKYPKSAKEIYTMDYDGFNLRKVSRRNSIHLAPTWNKDATKLAFITLNGLNWELWIATYTAEKISYAVVKGLPQSITSPSFSPSNPLLALSMATENDQEIFLVDPANKAKPKQLTNSWNIDVSPSFSPDGKRIVYTSTVSGQRQIYAMNSDGTFPVRLTFDGRNNESPTWSPAGDKIAFAGMDEDGDFDIFVMNTDGTDMRRLTYDSSSNEAPSFSPDGRYIVFASSRDAVIEGKTVKNKYHIYLMKANGDNQSLITPYPDGSFHDPDWGAVRK